MQITHCNPIYIRDYLYKIYSNYRMNRMRTLNSNAPTKSNTGGILDTMTKAISSVVSSVSGAVPNVMGKNTIRKNSNSTRKNSAVPSVTNPIEIPSMKMAGGTAPVNYRVSNSQPSDAIMRWATTAGVQNVVKGGKRSVHHKNRKTRRRKNNRRKSHIHK